MAKKILLVLILTAFGAVGAFALPPFSLSGGSGFQFTSDFGGGVEISSPLFGGKTGHIKTPFAGFGAFTFFDATYVEFNLGFFLGGGAWETKILEDRERIGMFDLGINIGLMAKYPFNIKDKLSIFPLAGISYSVRRSTETDSDTWDFDNLDALWFKFGAGLDIAFTNKFFLRIENLYGFRLKTRDEKDAVNNPNELANEWGLPSGSLNIKALRGHGLDIKVAAGFRFF